MLALALARLPTAVLSACVMIIMAPAQSGSGQGGSHVRKVQVQVQAQNRNRGTCPEASSLVPEALILSDVVCAGVPCLEPFA